MQASNRLLFALIEIVNIYLDNHRVIFAVKSIFGILKNK